MLDKAEAPIGNAFQLREIMVVLAFSTAEMDGKEKRERLSRLWLMCTIFLQKALHSDTPRMAVSIVWAIQEPALRLELPATLAWEILCAVFLATLVEALMAANFAPS